MPRYHNKDIKIFVALLPTLKNVFVCWDKFGNHRNSSPELLSLKKNLLKILKNLQGNTSAGVFFLKIRLKKEKGNSSTGVFPRIVLIFFRTLLLKDANRLLLLKALSRITHQNLVNFRGKHLSQSFAVV